MIGGEDGLMGSGGRESEGRRTGRHWKGIYCIMNFILYGLIQ